MAGSEVNRVIPLTVEKCAFGGDGFAHWGSRAVFVPGTLPGEEVRVRITAEKKDFLRGAVEEVITPSPDRIKPVCSMYGQCPGCVYGHCSYEAENRLKDQQFREFAARAGFAEEKILPCIAPEPADGYRNKLTLHVNKAGAEVMVGYALSDGQTILQISGCPLVHPAINELFAKQLADPGFRHTLHHRMSLTYRHTERNGVLFYRNNLPKGTSWIRENTSCGELSCPADGFFQVNPGGVNALLQELDQVLQAFSPEVFLDLYCGAGLFSAAAARAAVPVICGADIASGSVAAARYNLKQRGREDAVLEEGDAAQLLPGMLQKHAGKRILAVLDPPRGGITGRMRQNLEALPEKSCLVYISCHPATWSRDAAVLMNHGFTPCSARMVNQFGRTAHFEIFSVFTREKQ
ncbi:MAG: class I SAM-dependent RNA methyltransferase [Lentisphaeria bacterium]|nr:class I SAM-dependent RNA methyltransferase [Lentisphaeria bacterium]